MKKVLIAVFGMLLSAPLYSQVAGVNGYCSQGGVQSLTSSLKSTNYMNGVVIGCQITPYLTGTTTPAQYSLNATGLPLQTGPFTANTYGSLNPGAFLFFAPVGNGLDVVASGGIPPNSYPQPITILTDIIPGGGGGGVIGYPPAGIPHSSGSSWLASFGIQGSDINVMTSGAIFGTGAALCTDANGGATTSGCLSGTLGGSVSPFFTPYSNANNQLVNSPDFWDSTGALIHTFVSTTKEVHQTPESDFIGASGVAGGMSLAEGTLGFTPSSGQDLFYALGANHALMMNNNNTGAQYVVGATGLTSGFFPIASAPGSIVNSAMDQDHTTSGQITIGSGEGLTANQVIVSPLCTATSGANCNSNDLFIQSSGWDTGVVVSTTNAGSGYTPGTAYTPTITGETCTINPTPYAIGNLTGQLLVNVAPGFNCTVAGTITAPAPSSGTTWTGTLALTNAAQTDVWLNFLSYGTDATGFHSINGIYAPAHPSYPNTPVFGIVQAPEQGLMRGYVFDIDAPVGATATLSGSELTTAQTYKFPNASGDIATFVHGVPVNNDCAKWLVSGSTATLGDAGAACGSGGGVTGGACPAGQFTISINTSGVPTCALPSRIVDVQARYPASSGYATLGAKIIAAATDATIPCYAVFDATNGVAVDTGIGSSWSISGGNLSIVMPNQTGAVADQVLLTFASTSSLTGVYTIGSTTTSSTLVVPTASGLSSGTETVTMQPLSGTADIIIAKSCPQALKVPSLGVMKMNTAAATNATPSAPSVGITTGSLPAGTYYSTYKIKTASGRSLASAVTTTTLGSTGGLTFTSPSCGSDGESYNIYIGTSATAGSHVMQANQVCGQPFTFNLANLYPNEETDSAVSTPNPAIQLWNVNHGQLYADSGNNAGFEFQTYSTYAAGDIVAALGFGYTTEQRFTATNTAAITLGTDTANPTVGPASCYEEGIFWASLHKDVNCWGAGGTSTLPAFGEKTIGPMNDLVFDGYAPTCGGNYCYPGWIQRVPYIDGNSQGMHDITFKGTAPQTYSSSTYPPISVIGIPFGGNTAIPGGGIYSLAFEGLSLEGTANQGGYQFTDATSIQIKGGSVKIGATFGSGNAYSCVKIDTTIGSSNTWAGASNISWDHPVCTSANYEFLNDVDTGASVPTSAASTNTYAMTNPQDFGNAPNAAVGAAYFNDRNWNLHNSEILSDTGIVLGSPTGGYEGAGTINVLGCYVNGVACSTGGGTTYTNVVASASGDTTVAAINAKCTGGQTYWASIPLSIATGGTIASGCNVMFVKGGLWTIASGQTVTFANPVRENDGASQHFAGSGTVSLPPQDARVEWFGAVGYSTASAAASGTDSTTAIQATLNAMTSGNARLQALAYRQTAVLTISTSLIGIVGDKSGGSVLDNNYTISIDGPFSRLVNTSASADFIDAAGTSSALITSNEFRNFSMIRTTLATGTATGLSLAFAGGSIVDHVISNDSVRGFYCQVCAALGSGTITNSVSQLGYGTLTETSGTYYGFYFNSPTANGEDSLRLLNSGATQKGSLSGITTYGMLLTGELVSDVMTYGFETESQSYGQAVNYTGGSSGDFASNIHFTNSIHDGCQISCYYINDVNTSQFGSVSILGGWVNDNPSSSSVAAAIDIESSSGIAVQDVIIEQNIASKFTAGVSATSSSQILITGNNMISASATASVLLSSTNDSTVTGNKIYWNSGLASCTTLISVTGTSAYNNIQSNAMSGTCTNGISLGGSTASNNYQNRLSVDAGSITNPVVDSGLNFESTANVSRGTLALATSAISSGACQAVSAGSVNSSTATGVKTSDVIVWTPAVSIQTVTGYQVSTSGALSIDVYPTSGFINANVCNWTNGTVTPGALNLNWSVAR